MGRYLDALVFAENGEPKKPKIPATGGSLGSLGSLGTPPPHFQINCPLPIEDRQRITGWLDQVEEDDPAVIGDVLQRCETNLEARQYFIMRAGVVKQSSDERRSCTECVNLKDGYCEAARRGEMHDTGLVYRPWLGLPRRCECFI